MYAKVIILFALVALAIADNASPEKPKAQEPVKPVEAKKDKRGLLGLGYGAGWNGISTYSGLDGGIYGAGLHYTPGIGLGESIHTHSQSVITKEVPVGIPEPYAVPIDRHIPVPVKVPVAVPVDRPYPVHVPKPYPVEVTKHVPIPVDRPYPVAAPYPVKVAVPAPYPVGVPQPYAVPIVKHVAHPLIVEHNNGWHGINSYSSW